MKEDIDYQDNLFCNARRIQELETAVVMWRIRFCFVIAVNATIGLVWLLT